MATDMKMLVENFPGQLEEALAIGKKAKLSGASSEIKNVIISGLGGSGIGGTIISELVFDTCPVPVTVTKGYFLPAHADKNSLVIISSYSGNTEETLNCLREAVKKGSHVVCITSGGEVERLAKENRLDIILIPGGMPPRSCLGYSLTQLCFVLVHHRLAPAQLTGDIASSAKLLRERKEEIIAEAKELAGFLNGRTPVIYSTINNEGIAVRFRQQLNENAKVLCWHHVIPEMNHNELVGWAGGSEEYAVVLFRHHDDYERNRTRIEINKDIISKFTPHIREVYSEGKSAMEKMFYLVHLGDWASVFLAALRDVDAVEVNVINFLKGELAKK
ncbi:MAG TPA: bifunctional phosphoglucose/phosphomannose isomerase [Bacteroidia bacterium]|nr:bifunctional phosphoglucose/phosphomannose isomerase [Bacteroidia bacterium]